MLSSTCFLSTKCTVCVEVLREAKAGAVVFNWGQTFWIGEQKVSVSVSICFGFFIFPKEWENIVFPEKSMTPHRQKSQRVRGNSCTPASQPRLGCWAAGWATGPRLTCVLWANCLVPPAGSPRKGISGAQLSVLMGTLAGRDHPLISISFARLGLVYIY